MQAKTFFDNIKELLEDGQSVIVPVPGYSMEPFLFPSCDKVIIKAYDGNLKPGDIPIYKRGEFIYVLHRVVKVDGEFFYAIGDKETVVEGPIPRENIIAITQKAIYNGKELTEHSFRWKFYSRIWRRIIKPRPLFIRIIFKIRRMQGKNIT